MKMIARKALVVVAVVAAVAFTHSRMTQAEGTSENGGKDQHAPAAAAANEHGHDHEGHAHAEHGDAGHGHADEVKLTPEAVRRNDIRVAAVTKRPLAASFVAPARVAYNDEAMAHVGSIVKGRAVEIKVKLGDSVKIGDGMIVVESPELGEAQSDYLQKVTGLSVATSAVEPSKQAVERASKLYEKSQGVALGEVQKREAEFKASQGAVQTAQAALDAAGNKLLLMGFDKQAVDALDRSKQINARYVVRTPIAGTVVRRDVTLGELVSPEKEALLVVADLSSVWVVADVPEAKLDEVGIGSAARVRVAANGGAVEGKISYVAPSLDPSTRTAQVRIVVPNPKGSLRPGMFARADLTTGSAAADATPVLAVPEDAVQTVEGKPSVFVPVEGEANTFATRAVKVGRPLNGMLPVESGLTEGEQVVVSGTFILKADLGKLGAAHEH
jgi:cobalt-zinc-cadmium efflux system membrane fusion protein